MRKGLFDRFENLLSKDIWTVEHTFVFSNSCWGVVFYSGHCYALLTLIMIDLFGAAQGWASQKHPSPFLKCATHVLQW